MPGRSGDVPIEAGKVVGLFEDDGEDGCRKIATGEGILEKNGRGRVLDDVVARRHSQWWRRRWIPPKLLVRRRR